MLLLKRAQPAGPVLLVAAKRQMSALLAEVSLHARRELVVSGNSRVVWIKGAKPKWPCSYEHNPQNPFHSWERND